MHHNVYSQPRQVIPFAVAAFCLFALAASPARAQNTTQTLDATSGTATVSTNYTTGTMGTAGLTLNMGFFVDYRGGYRPVVGLAERHGIGIDSGQPE